MLKALQTLKSLGNPYYQFVPDINQYKQKLLVSDIEGFNFLYPEEGEEKEIDETHENMEYANKESQAYSNSEVSIAEDDKENTTEDIEENE